MKDRKPGSYLNDKGVIKPNPKDKAMNARTKKEVKEDAKDKSSSSGKN